MSGVRAAGAFVELYLNDKEFKNGLKQAQMKMQSFANTAKSIGMNFVGLGAAIVTPLALAAREFAGFEQEMATVGAVTQTVGAEFDKLTEKAKQLGLTTTFTAKESAEAMVKLGRAGLSSSQIIGTIPNVLDLARATATDLAEAAQITASVMRIFGLEAKDTTRIVDVLTATANNSAQTIEGLSEAMKFVGPFAKQAGQSLEETASLLGILANNGIRGTVAGTSLARMFKNLSQNAKIKQLKDLGVDVADANGNFRKMTAILADLQKVTKSLGTQKRLSIFEDLFGRGAAGALTLAKVIPQVDELNKKIKSSGQAKATAAKMDDTLAGSTRLLTSALQGLAITIGDALSPALRMLFEGGKKVLIFLESAIKYFGTFGKVAITAAAAIGGMIIAVGGALVLAGVFASLIANLQTIAPLLVSTAIKIGLIGSASTTTSLHMAPFIASIWSATSAMGAFALSFAPVAAAIAVVSLTAWGIKISTDIDRVRANIDKLNESTKDLQHLSMALDRATNTGLNSTLEQATKDAKATVVAWVKGGDAVSVIVKKLKAAVDINRKIASQSTRGLANEDLLIKQGQIKEASRNLVAYQKILNEFNSGNADAMTKYGDIVDLEESLDKRRAKSKRLTAKEIEAIQKKEIARLKAIETEKKKTITDLSNLSKQRGSNRIAERQQIKIDKLIGSDPFNAAKQFNEEYAQAVRDTAVNIKETIKIIKEGGLSVGDMKALRDNVDASVKAEEIAKVNAKAAVAAKIEREKQAAKVLTDFEARLSAERTRKFSEATQKAFDDLLAKDPTAALETAFEKLNLGENVLDDLIAKTKEWQQVAAKTGLPKDLQRAQDSLENVSKQMEKNANAQSMVDAATSALSDIQPPDFSAFGTFSAAEAQGLADKAGEKIQKKQLAVQEENVDVNRKTLKAIKKINFGWG